METSRLDCSLDQLISTSGRQRERRPLRQSRGARPVTSARKVEGVLSARNRRAEIQVRHTPSKHSANNAGQPMFPGGYIALPAQYSAPHQGNRLTPGEVAMHTCTVEKRESGDVVLTFKETEVLIAKAATGDLILNSGGYRTFSTKAVLTTALQPVGLRIDEQVHNDDNQPTWIVSDGRAFSQVFEDGMIIKQTGHLSRHQLMARGSVIAQFVQQKKAGLAKKMYRRRASPRRPEENESVIQ